MSTVFINSFWQANKTYAQILVDDYGAAEVWPLVNIASGTTITAYVNAARNGTLTGWGLQNAAGPVPGTLAPYTDGVGDLGDVLTSGGGVGLVDIFNGATGAVFGWVKKPAWDATSRTMFYVRNAPNTSAIFIRELNATGFMRFEYVAGGTGETIQQSGLSTTDWFSWALTWDISAGASGEVKAHINGSQIGSTATTLGTWAGPITSAYIGAVAAGTFLHLGHMAYYAIKAGSVWSGAEIAAMHAAAATSGAD
jgi:hypothetical protein